jgi:cytochrome-b5 reductase
MSSKNFDLTTLFMGMIGLNKNNVAADEKLTLALFVGTTIFVTIASSLYLLKKEKTAMDPTADFKPFTMIRKESLSHDTRRFTFALQSPKMKLGLPIGQHISLRFRDSNGKNHQRSYTPVTGDETLGEVSFVIKVYKAGVHPKFPEGGKMSQHLDSLNVGDTIEMKGPKGHLTYLGRGDFTVKQMRKPLETRKANHFGMIAGGTGITPMLQVLHAIFRDSKDTTTTASLLFANQTEDDILVQDELETLAKEFPDRFKLHYTLDRPPADWKFSTGFVNKEMVQNHVLKGGNADDGMTQVLMCGPPPMIKYACIPALEELKLDGSKRFSF